MFKNVVINNKKNRQNSRSFLDFAFAEYSSAIEMLQAAKKTNNENLARGFLNHTLDEFKHTSFFLKCLNNIKIQENYDQNLRFDSRHVYNLGFINKKYFLYDKYPLSQFCVFIMINESQALKLFTKIKKLGIISNINDKKVLNNIIDDERKHLEEAKKNEVLDNQYEELLFDERKHVNLSNNFSKKLNSNVKYRIFSIKFFISNKLRHFISKNTYLNSSINLIISYFIILLVFPLKIALNFNEPTNKKISFSSKKSKLML